MAIYEVRVQADNGKIHEVKVEAPSQSEAEMIATNHVVDMYDRMNSATLSRKDHGKNAYVDPGFTGAASLAFGRSVDKLLDGADSLLFADEEEKLQIAAKQKAADQAYEPVAEDYPVTTFAGEVAPYMAGGPASVGRMTAGKIGGEVGFQSMLGFLDYAEELSDRFTTGGVSGALTSIPFLGKLKKGYDNVVGGATDAPAMQRFKDGVDGAVPDRPGQDPTTNIDLRDPVDASQSRNVNPRLVQRADELGYSLTPGQRTGNTTLMRLEEGFGSSPWTSGPYDKMKGDNQRLLNRKAAETIGMNSDAVTDDILDTAHARISNAFDELTMRGEVDLNGGALDKMVDMLDEADRGLFDSVELEGLMTKILDLSNDGKLSAEQYQKFSSQLMQLHRKLMKGESSNPDLAFRVADLKGILDDAVEESLGGETLAMFQAARKAWKNYLTLTKRPGVVSPENGDVSPRMLRNQLLREDKAGYQRGRNKSDFYDVVRMGQQFKSPVGDSGTATRLGAMDALKVLPLMKGGLMMGGNQAYLQGDKLIRAAARNPHVMGRLAAHGGGLLLERDEPENYVERVDELERRGYR